MSLNILTTNKTNKAALMPPAPKRPTLSLETDRLEEPKLLKVNSGTNALLSGEVSRPLESKSLANPNFPLGTDITNMQVTDHEKQIILKLASEIGGTLDIFRANRNTQVEEIETSLENIRNADSITNAKASIDSLRNVKNKLDNFKESSKTIRIFNTQNPGFIGLNNAMARLIEEYKNASNYDTLTSKIYEISEIAKLCNEFTKLTEFVSEDSSTISQEDKAKVAEIINHMKFSTLSEMPANLFKIRNIAVINTDQAKFEKTEKNIKNAVQSRISNIDNLLAKIELSELQQQQLVRLLTELHSYQSDKKSSILSSIDVTNRNIDSELPQSRENDLKLQILNEQGVYRYLAEYSLEETLEDMKSFDTIVASILGNAVLVQKKDAPTNATPNNSEQVVKRSPEANSEILASSDGVEDDKKEVAGKINQTTQAPESSPTNKSATVSNKPAINKPSGFLQGTRNFFAKLTPRQIIAGLTATTVTAISTPVIIDNFSNTPVSNEILPKSDTRRLISSLEKSGLGSGQLAQALKKNPSSIEVLATMRAELTQPEQTIEQQRAQARRFVDSAFKSEQITPGQKIISAAIAENKNNPGVVEKLAETRIRYSGGD
jgi:hypothetical protein